VQLFISTTDSQSTAEVFQGSQFSEQRVTSYARLLVGRELARRVVDKLDLSLTAEQLADRVEAETVPDTVLLQVAVSDSLPSRARAIANAIGEEFPRLITELETPNSEGQSPVKVTVTDAAETPDEASSPNTARNVALGLLAGAVLGSGAAVGRAGLDRTVKDAGEAEELAGAPVIGMVLRDDALNRQHLVPRGSGTRTAENFRQLRTNLQFLNVDEPPKVIMVSSAVPSEGKTTVVVNLALALADAGRTVTVIEADLRKPKVTRYLGMVGGAGLTNILAGTADLDDVVMPYGAGQVRVIAAGPTPPNPGELLSSSHMVELMERLRGESDFVLVDAPPLLPVADSSGLAVIMDGVLLSVRYGVTTKGQLKQAAVVLDRVGAKALGVILNIVPPKADLASAYGYGYSYEVDAKHR
jgi:capsular exopolysaccharide synthesis family protein